MTDRERIAEVASKCLQDVHGAASAFVPCVPCILKLVEDVREEALRGTRTA